MPTVVVIPVKSFTMGKRRLATALDQGARAAVGQALADHVATTVASAGLMPLLVTADPDVAEWSTLAGFPSIPDPGEGLDTAAATGVAWALESGSDWIVLHSDLPLLSVADVAQLTKPLSDGRVVLAPSADGGTSAVGSRGPAVFGFGIASFHRHLRTWPDATVVARAGLLLDVDAPGDLRAAMSTAEGRWLEEVVGGWGAR